MDQDLLIIEAPWSHTFRHTTHCWTVDQPEAETYLTTHNTYKRQTSMPSVGFKPNNPSKRAVAHPRLRPRGHWDRPNFLVNRKKSTGYDVYTRSNTEPVQFIHVFKHSAWFSQRTAIRFPMQYSPTGLSKGSLFCVRYELNVYIYYGISPVINAFSQWMHKTNWLKTNQYS